MKKDKDKLSMFKVAKSVLAAFFGVQSNAQRQRDFEKGNPMHFIYVGLIATILFILVVIGLVQMVLYFSL